MPSEHHRPPPPARFAWLTCGGRPIGARALGLVLIFATAVIWVAASFLSAALVSSDDGSGTSTPHAPPFLLTYLATSVFTAFLPAVHGKRLVGRILERRRQRLGLGGGGIGGTGGGGGAQYRYTPVGTAAPGDGVVGGGAGGAPRASLSISGSSDGGGGGIGGAADGDFAAALDAAEAEAVAAEADKLGSGTGGWPAAWEAEREAAGAAARCFLLWFAAQLAFNVSLGMTSVTSNTILSSSSSLFTFALSMVFLREPYTAAKLLSIFACIGGTALVTLSDEYSGSKGAAGAARSVGGDALCLASAALYAGYTIAMRRALPDEGEADVALFFGYVGLLCTGVFAPVLAGLVLSGAMPLDGVSREALGLIFLQGVLNYAFSDYLWAHAVLLLGPTLATLGLSVQIPIAAAVDAALGRAAWLSSGAATAMTLVGTALILAGFFAGHLAGAGEPPAGSHHRGEPADAAAAGARPRVRSLPLSPVRTDGERAGAAAASLPARSFDSERPAAGRSSSSQQQQQQCLGHL